MNSSEIEKALLTAGNSEKASGMQRYFKTGKGEYGEGDIFIGITTPEMHRFVKTYKHVALTEAVKLLASPYHEIRACALQIMVEQYQKGDENLRETIVQSYLLNTARINNWDLVDSSAPDIIGEHLLTRDRGLLYTLAASQLLWEQRIAIISTLTFIRHGDFTDTLKLAKLLLPHKHDLMHKAVGWMLREVGKRHRETLTVFLQGHRLAMPRTALRYAIEHYSEAERKAFMQR